MAKDFLFGIGVEELPASFVENALRAMPRIAEELLEGARLAHGAIRPLGTPRRLALSIEKLAEGQSDLSEEVTGPPTSIGIGADGKPTKAALGFAKKYGLGADAIKVVTTGKGDYIAVHRSETGRPAAEVLAELLPELCRRIPFAKSMRWGPGDIAFGRPVHWLVALHGTDTVPVEFAHTTAGRATRGHRFLSPQSFDLPSAGDYESRLEAAHVVVDPEVRKARMVDALHAACKELGGVLVPDDFLVHECATLVEEPHVVPGRFDPAFLKLPEGVVISVMRDHQRYFAVRDAGGKLLPAYLNVVNTAEAPQTISAGNDRVLQARLKDAQFFVEEDRKSSLHSRVVGLDRVVFQTKLGSIGDKVRRIRELVLALGDGEEAKLAAEAARLAKTDLISLIVGEFPELQGEMGAFYAREEGIHPDVATAIAEHYWPKGAGGAVPSQVVGALVAVADRADTLVGCFGIGLEPTGSADPFALRRAAVGIMRIANEGPRDFDLHSTLSAAYDHYEGVALKGKDEVLAALDAFFRARLRAHYAEGRPGDLVDACLAAWPGTSLRDLDARVRAVTAFREMPEYESLSVAFKRAFNIAKDAPAGDIDVALLTDEAEKALAERFQAVRGPVDGAVAEGRYEDALRLIAKDLRGPIDAFFEQVFVMVDDPKVRDNRLRLLGGIARMLTAIAHFNQLS